MGPILTSSIQPPGSPPDWFYPGIATVILYHTIGLLCQTFFFGIYASLTIYSTYFMLTTGFKNGVRKTLFLISMFTFLVSAIFWATKTIDLIRLIAVNLIGHQPAPSITNWATHAGLISGAFVLMNYALTDAVVFWRAWILCSADFRRILYVPLFFLCCAFMSISATVVVRITIQCIPHQDATTTDPRVKSLTRAIDILQVANLAFSLLLNVSATAIIAVKAWRFRQWVKFDFSALKSRRTRGEKIMAILVESGLLYCLSGITVLITTVIRLPVGTLGDIYTPVNTQIAGMYPIVVLLLVSHGKTLENTVFPRITTNGPPEAPIESARGESGVLESMRFRGAAINSENFSRHVISDDQVIEVRRYPKDHHRSPSLLNNPDGYAVGTGTSPRPDAKRGSKSMEAMGN
ncbi:hypothetical protein PQX77_018191 [Marasmius sp. AFHP31]|nr:hypothetical protein PQX77_018191 [Marasmius sp. AFHP31]